MKPSVGTVLVGAVIVLILASLSLFVVDQRQNAMVLRLGQVVKVETTPGLYFKVPLFDNVRYFDIRILTIDTAEPEHFLTSEKKNVLVDLFVKWRITDVLQYYRSIVQGGGGEMQAQTRLLQTINDGLRAEFGNRTVHDVVSGERDVDCSGGGAGSVLAAGSAGRAPPICMILSSGRYSRLLPFWSTITFVVLPRTCSTVSM